MRPSQIKSTACLLGLISLLAVIVSCEQLGIKRFFGAEKQTNPTAPCEEIVPAATPIPPPAPLVPMEPSRAPIPVAPMPPEPEPAPEPAPPGECEGPGQLLICRGEVPPGPDFELLPEPDISPGSEAAPMGKTFKPVKLNGHDLKWTSKILRDIKGSGIDMLISSVNNVLTINFSQPVSSAYLRTSGNTDDVIVKAFDKSDSVVDMDISASEVMIYGRDIVKLVFVKADGRLDELSFIPQL